MGSFDPVPMISCQTIHFFVQAKLCSVHGNNLKALSRNGWWQWESNVMLILKVEVFLVMFLIQKLVNNPD